jgi:hypothetical protein
MSEEQKKTDEEILFPNVEVCGITIKPWNFGKLFEISPSLESIIDKAEAKGIVEEFYNSDILRYTTIAKLFLLASNDLMKIICITTGVEEEKVKSLSIEDGTKIILTIYNQNSELVKNALSPLLARR